MFRGLSRAAFVRGVTISRTCSEGAALFIVAPSPGTLGSEYSVDDGLELANRGLQVSPAALIERATCERFHECDGLCSLNAQMTRGLQEQGSIERHDYASILAKQHVASRAAQDMMRHDSTTASIYQHV